MLSCQDGVVYEYANHGPSEPDDCYGTIELGSCLHGCANLEQLDFPEPACCATYTCESCSPEETGLCAEPALPEVPNLVFQTGFESATEHVSATDTTAPCTDDLLGVDQSVSEKGDWENDLEGGALGVGHFCFGGGTPAQRGIALVPDPDDPDNQVLHT